jgi:hypothetical protein
MPNTAHHMLSKHVAALIGLIYAQIEETSNGLANCHHMHNVQCGIENIVSLLEPSEALVDTSAQLFRLARSYIASHDPTASNMSEADASEDAARLRAAQAALTHFRSAVEQSRPNARARTLGLMG